MSNEKYFSPEDIRMDREGYRCLIPQALMNAIDISKGSLDYLASGKNGTFNILLEKQGLNPKKTVILTACGIRDSIADLIIQYYAFEARQHIKTKAYEIYNDYKDIGFEKWLDQQLAEDDDDSENDDNDVQIQLIAAANQLAQLAEVLSSRTPRKNAS